MKIYHRCFHQMRMTSHVGNMQSIIGKNMKQWLMLIWKKEIKGVCIDVSQVTGFWQKELMRELRMEISDIMLKRDILAFHRLDLTTGDFGALTSGHFLMHGMAWERLIRQECPTRGFITHILTRIIQLIIEIRRGHSAAKHGQLK